MSDHRVNREQENEIQAGIGSRLQHGRIDYEARLRQNMERARLAATNADATNSNSNSTQENLTGNSTAIAEQTQQVLVTGRPIALRLWELFEDTDNFNGNVQEIWDEFNAMTPWKKVVIVLGILALFFLIGGLGYFTWQFVCYMWPHLVTFANQYGSTIASYGVNFLNTIETSGLYRNFVENFQNNGENIDASGLGAFVTLGMPPMLAMYRAFFMYLSTQGSG